MYYPCQKECTAEKDKDFSLPFSREISVEKNRFPVLRYWNKQENKSGVYRFLFLPLISPRYLFFPSQAVVELSSIVLENYLQNE